ncbi:hypothetical protein Taro_006892 [Colocasia esculenta]|uniref:Uncharacterized protein n=1 Tax=Colocasia esculenta TaxID=4460 RepID=A0A843U265_COLES|nr:hypothetical protein [Colocasia esculenta]
MSQVDLTVEQGIATCPMWPSGLLKATGPMSPSHVQRVKCPRREHKPQFVPLLGATFFSGELRLGGLRGSLGGGLGVPLQGKVLVVVVLVLPWLISPSLCLPLSLACLDALQGRGSARFVGGGSWIVGSRRWRVANLREGPLRLDLHLEVRLHSSSLRGVARRWACSNPWAAVPTVGSLVGAGDPGAGAVTQTQLRDLHKRLYAAAHHRFPLDSGVRQHICQLEHARSLENSLNRLTKMGVPGKQRQPLNGTSPQVPSTGRKRTGGATTTSKRHS